MANTKRVRILHRMPVRCPKCSAPIRMRITDDGKKALARAIQIADYDEDTVIQTYQCARKRPDGSLCNGLVEITLRHWREDSW